MPAAKKDPSVRARRNVAATASTLPVSASTRVAPGLPEGREWHPMTVAWWRDVWASPMAKEFCDVDARGLIRLACLENDYWTADSAKDRKDAATEIRLQQKDYGLTPYDRRRLEWTIESAEEAQERGRSRRSRASVPQPPVGDDPRAALRSVG